MTTKHTESVKKLSEGLNLIELQNDERGRKFEQVIQAEIKSRKHNEKDFGERLENHNQKFTYAMQSFQSTLGNLSQRISDQKETVDDQLYILIFLGHFTFYIILKSQID